MCGQTRRFVDLVEFLPCCVTDIVHTEHRAQRAEELIDPAAWHRTYRFARRPNHDGTAAGIRIHTT